MANALLQYKGIQIGLNVFSNKQDWFLITGMRLIKKDFITLVYNHMECQKHEKQNRILHRTVKMLPVTVMWLELVKFCLFGEFLSLWVYLVLGKIVNILFMLLEPYLFKLSNDK